MKIDEYRIGDYKDILDGTAPWPWKGEVQPVSRQRMVAQVRNPRAEDADVALLVGSDKDGIVSYLGILPDRILLDQQSHKFGWLSTWWVRPGAEGVGPVFLLMRALKCYSNRIGVSEYSKSAARIYRAMGKKFRILCNRTVTYHHIRPDFVEVAVRRYGHSALVRTLSGAARNLVDVVMGIRIAWWSRSQSLRRQPVCIEYVGQLDARSAAYLESFDRSNEVFRREITDLNWLLNQRWALVTPLRDIEYGRYAFSVQAQRFEILALHILRENGAIGGLLILTFRDGKLKVPYAFVDSDMWDSAGMVVCQHARALRARMLLTVDHRMTEAVSAIGLPCVMKKTEPRESLGSVHDGLPADIYMHDGDGDCAFT